MDFINQAAAQLNHALTFLHNNMLAIGLCVGVLLFLRSRVVVRKPTGTALAASSSSRDLRRVRLQQQEELQQKSRQAAKLRKAKQEEEKKRRNEVALKKLPGPGRRLDESDSKKNKSTTSTTSSTTSRSSGGYNPMQPWSGASRGYRCVCFEKKKGWISLARSQGMRRQRAFSSSLFGKCSRPQRRTVRRG